MNTVTRCEVDQRPDNRPYTAIDICHKSGDNDPGLRAAPVESGKKTATPTAMGKNRECERKSSLAGTE
ncbi:hypothetical protein [Mangrovibacter sp. MFB070]|uniref:hypothetical protein n=1 Tax=Mangrovibacter sp. MFB070 TaxID=1224318 RepID=UPI001267ED58|nr:hypothetical protein [Mangrovibacter sp. MFB070]